MNITANSTATKTDDVIKFTCDVNVDGRVAKFSKTFNKDVKKDKTTFDFEYIDSNLDIVVKPMVLWDSPTVLVVVIKAFTNGDVVATTLSHFF